MMKTTWKIGVGVAIALMAGIVTRAESSAVLLPFQGLLTDAGGKALKATIRLVQFKVFDAPVGGNVVWAGETHRLSVNEGRVNTILGSRVALDVTVFSRLVYLEMTIDSDGDHQITPSDPPLLPRQAIIPAIFASSAGGLLTRNAAGDIVSKGFDAILSENNVATGRILPDLIGRSSISSEKIASLKGSKLETGSVPMDRVDWSTKNPSVPGAVLNVGSVPLDRLDWSGDQSTISGRLLSDGTVMLAKLRASSLVSPAGRNIQVAPLGDIAESLSIEEFLLNANNGGGTSHEVADTRLGLETRGGPVFVHLTAARNEPGKSAAARIGLSTGGNGNDKVNLKIHLIRQTPGGAATPVGRPQTFHLNGGTAIDYPANLSWIDASAPPGRHFYFLKVEPGFSTESNTVVLNGCRLIAYEK